MNTIHDFLTLVREDLGLPVTAQQATVSLDQVPGWDSVYLLTLLVALERRTGRNLALADLLDAGSLQEIYALAVAR